MLQTQQATENKFYSNTISTLRYLIFTLSVTSFYIKPMLRTNKVKLLHYFKPIKRSPLFK